ncbi:MAG: pyridoxal-phosphate dependent enzyme [Bacteroidetes bacterium]|nr:MAG: pyridoxal-phosphate dependent enzyme [Bacteroidota bacterium]
MPPIPLTLWENEVFEKAQIKVYLARLDLIHPDFGGNKFFKLKYNLEEARRQGKDTLVTFGGAYSNHIWATSAVGHTAGLKTIGYIRGEETLPLNEVLAQAKAWGMELRYVDRTAYRTLKAGELPCLPHEYTIPEGGSNKWAVKGCSEILDLIDLPDYQYVCVPCGTGATLAGLAVGKAGKHCLGVSVLKGGSFLNEDVQQLIQQAGKTATNTWEILLDYHAGGYAKTSPTLQAFCQHFATTYFKLDEVYTAKMLWAIEDLARKERFPAKSTIVALITQRQLGELGRPDAQPNGQKHEK